MPTQPVRLLLDRLAGILQTFDTTTGTCLLVTQASPAWDQSEHKLATNGTNVRLFQIRFQAQ